MILFDRKFYWLPRIPFQPIPLSVSLAQKIVFPPSFIWLVYFQQTTGHRIVWQQHLLEDFASSGLQKAQKARNLRLIGVPREFFYPV